MSELIYFLHRDGIIEFNPYTGARREMCVPMPEVPQEALDYARRLNEVCEMITGVPPQLTPAISPDSSLPKKS